MLTRELVASGTLKGIDWGSFAWYARVMAGDTGGNHENMTMMDGSYGKPPISSSQK